MDRRSRILSVPDGRTQLGSTWADATAEGETDKGSPDRAISGITLDGRLFMQVRPTSYDAEASSDFYASSYARCAGKIVLIWDGAPIHRAREIKDFLKRGAAKRLHLEQLPDYASDLNPDEGIWNYRVAASSWAISAAPTRDHLYRELIHAKERLRHKTEIITSCSRQYGYLL